MPRLKRGRKAIGRRLKQSRNAERKPKELEKNDQDHQDHSFSLENKEWVFEYHNCNTDQHNPVGDEIQVKVEPIEPGLQIDKEIEVDVCSLPISENHDSVLNINKQLFPSISSEIQNSNKLLYLYKELAHILVHPYGVKFSPYHEIIEIFEYYHLNGKASSIKLSVTIAKDFCVEISVHRNIISSTHELWAGLPPIVNSVYDVKVLLQILSEYGVCIGHPETDFHELLAIGNTMSHSVSSPQKYIYREGDFCATRGNLEYNSTLRSSRCSFLVKGSRCVNCSQYRRNLQRTKRIKEKRKHGDNLPITYKHHDMSRDMLYKKLSQQTKHIQSLKGKVDRLKRNVSRQLLKE